MRKENSGTLVGAPGIRADRSLAIDCPDAIQGRYDPTSDGSNQGISGILEEPVRFLPKFAPLARSAAGNVVVLHSGRPPNTPERSQRVRVRSVDLVYLPLLTKPLTFAFETVIHSVGKPPT